MHKVVAKSYFHLVAAPCWAGDKLPLTAEEFLKLVVDEVSSEANLGPYRRLRVREPGTLVGKTFVTPGLPNARNGRDVTDPHFRRKGYWEYLYRVRVVGPPKDVNIITANIKAECGPQFESVTPRRLRKLGWNPVDSKGRLICTNGKHVKV
jgi:hypothetical protein